jgi:2'-5' RNA ligase
VTAVRRTAIVAPIRLPPALEEIRGRATSGPRAGVPAHITLLSPFVPTDSIDSSTLARVADVLAGVRAFEVTFARVQRWGPRAGAPEGLVWLDPDPPQGFVLLTRALWRAFPDHPPYGGLHNEPIPHLTIASHAQKTFDAIETEARRRLPFRRRVAVVALLVEGVDGHWRTSNGFSLARQT